jgi:N-hydroxyarylamine O-acetyltransferase
VFHVSLGIWIIHFGKEISLKPAGIVHRQFGDRFKLEQDLVLGFVFQTYQEEGRLNQYVFTADLHHPIDFTFANYHHSHSPQSIFTQKRICQLSTPKAADAWTTELCRCPSTASCRSQLSIAKQEFIEILRKDFGLIFR